MGDVVEQGGQYPEPAGGGRASLVGGGHPELDEAGDRVRKPGRLPVAGPRAAQGEHRVGLAQPQQL